MYLFYSDNTQSDPVAYPNITFWVIENKGELGVPEQNPEHPALLLSSIYLKKS